MSSQLTPLELAALNAALSGPELWKAKLRNQIPCLSVRCRTDTVVGGYVDFELSFNEHRVALTPEETKHPATADVRHPDLPSGGAFIVWLTDGVIAQLEYYSNDDASWPRGDRDKLAAFQFIKPA